MAACVSQGVTAPERGYNRDYSVIFVSLGIIYNYCSASFSFRDVFPANARVLFKCQKYSNPAMPTPEVTTKLYSEESHSYISL